MRFTAEQSGVQVRLEQDKDEVNVYLDNDILVGYFTNGVFELIYCTDSERVRLESKGIKFDSEGLLKVDR